jgi:catabolite regulation protein CreA
MNILVIALIVFADLGICNGFSFRMNRIVKKITTGVVATALVGSGLPIVGNADSTSRRVGEISTSGLVFKDTLKVDAVDDSETGVTIYLTEFERPLNEKLSNGFEEPTATSIACSGKPKGDLNSLNTDEEIYGENKNLIFKQIHLRRLIDPTAKNVIYVTYSTRLDKGKDANKGRFKSSTCVVHAD